MAGRFVERREELAGPKKLHPRHGRVNSSKVAFLEGLKRKVLTQHRVFKNDSAKWRNMVFECSRQISR